MTQPGTLTDRESDFCTSAGILGSVLSLVVLGQHMYIMPPENLMVLIPYSIFIYCTVSFAMLIRKSPAAATLIIIAAALVFVYVLLLAWLFFYYGLFIFSYILPGLLIYMIIILVLMYMDKLPAKLRDYRQFKRSEDEFWTGKV